jgi:hypothetical protein
MAATPVPAVMAREVPSRVSPGSNVATRPSAWASTHAGSVGSTPVSYRASGALTYGMEAAPTIT